MRILPSVSRSAVASVALSVLLFSTPALRAADGAPHVREGEVWSGEPPRLVTDAAGQMVENEFFLISPSGRYLAAPRKTGEHPISVEEGSERMQYAPEWSVMIINLETGEVVHELTSPRELLHPGAWRKEGDEYDFAVGDDQAADGMYGFDPVSGQFAALEYDKRRNAYRSLHERPLSAASETPRPVSVASPFAVAVPAAAPSREFVSTEQLVTRMAVVFTGTLSEVKEVDTPTRENVLYDSDRALKLRIVDVKWRKPASKAPVATIFTWTAAKAPCTPPKLAVGDPIVVLAEFDSSGKFMIADSCRDIQPSDSTAGRDFIQTMNSFFKKQP